MSYARRAAALQDLQTGQDQARRACALLYACLKHRAYMSTHPVASSSSCLMLRQLCLQSLRQLRLILLFAWCSCSTELSGREPGLQRGQRGQLHRSARGPEHRRQPGRQGPLGQPEGHASHKLPGDGTATGTRLPNPRQFSTHPSSCRQNPLWWGGSQTWSAVKEYAAG